VQLLGRRVRAIGLINDHSFSTDSLKSPFKTFRQLAEVFLVTQSSNGIFTNSNEALINPNVLLYSLVINFNKLQGKSLVHPRKELQHPAAFNRRLPHGDLLYKKELVFHSAHHGAVDSVAKRIGLMYRDIDKHRLPHHTDTFKSHISSVFYC